MLNALPFEPGVVDLVERDGSAQLLPEGVLRFGGKGS